MVNQVAGVLNILSYVQYPEKKVTDIFFVLGIQIDIKERRSWQKNSWHFLIKEKFGLFNKILISCEICIMYIWKCSMGPFEWCITENSF